MLEVVNKSFVVDNIEAQVGKVSQGNYQLSRFNLDGVRTLSLFYSYVIRLKLILNFLYLKIYNFSFQCEDSISM